MGGCEPASALSSPSGGLTGVTAGSDGGPLAVLCCDILSEEYISTGYSPPPGPWSVLDPRSAMYMCCCLDTRRVWTSPAPCLQRARVY